MEDVVEWDGGAEAGWMWWRLSRRKRDVVELEGEWKGKEVEGEEEKDAEVGKEEGKVVEMKGEEDEKMGKDGVEAELDEELGGRRRRRSGNRRRRGGEESR